MPTFTERPPSTGRSHATLPVVLVLGAAAILFFYDWPPASFAPACARGGAAIYNVTDLDARCRKLRR